MSKAKNRRKAPAGMPPEIAKALNLKRKGAPRKSPIPPRSANPLEYLLWQSSRGKGVVLPAPDALALASSFMDSQNWLRELNRQLSEFEDTRAAIEAVLECDSETKLEELESLMFPQEFEDDEEEE